MAIFKIITLDNETGGLTDDVSLLTTTIQIYEVYKESQWTYKLIDELDLKLKPDKNEPMIIHPEAMAVNKINLIKHYSEAITYKEAGTLIYNLLNKNFSEHKFIPMGQNIQADIQKLFTSKIISENSWTNYVSVKIIELMTLSQLLILNGTFPIDQSCSLSNVAKKLKIKIDKRKLHTSKYDTQLNIEVFIKILNVLNKDFFNK